MLDVLICIFRVFIFLLLLVSASGYVRLPWHLLKVCQSVRVCHFGRNGWSGRHQSGWKRAGGGNLVVSRGSCGRHHQKGIAIVGSHFSGCLLCVSDFMLTFAGCSDEDTCLYHRVFADVHAAYALAVRAGFRLGSSHHHTLVGRSFHAVGIPHSPLLGHRWQVP